MALASLGKSFSSFYKTDGQRWSKYRTVSSAPQLEANLAERERQVLEKELLTEQVTRLSEPLSEQVDLRQRDGLSLAKKVDDSNV